MHTAYALPPASRTKFRDIPIDLLRGIAIALMVGANTVPYLLAPPAPFWLRVLASLAAPLFILLSGMMVALSRTRKQYDLRYFLIRGGLVLLIAAGLEAVVWRIFPFIDMDVLFLIGISLPLAYLFLALDRRVRWGIILALFCSAPVLQLVFGYPLLPVQIPVAGAAVGIAGLSLPVVAGHWFISGWFPVFPWLGLAFLGAELGTIRWTGTAITSFATRRFAAVGLGMLATGIVLWSFFPARNWYGTGMSSSLPAGPGVLPYGLWRDPLHVRDRRPAPAGFSFDPLRAMGECSLAIYILHSVIIAWCIQPFHLLLPLPLFLLCVIAFIGGMCAFAYLLRRLRPALAGRSLVVRFLMGG